MNSFDYKGSYALQDMPVAPLPSPGEGGPVFPGNGGPMVPLPEPGEGGPVFPSPGVPTVPLPSPGEGGPVFPSPGVPTVPLPSPGEGGPVFPSPGVPTIPLPSPGEGGPVFPGPGFPIRPQPQQYGTVRFLNAATGYQPLRVRVNNRFIAGNLTLASLTPYRRLAAGPQTITVSGPNGYIYLQKNMLITAGETSTIAIINSDQGLDLLQISDNPCARPAGMSCFRACNLAYYGNPMNVMLYGGTPIYTDVRFQEVTPFRQIRPAEYQFYLTETAPPSPVLVSFYVDVVPDETYTVYILSSGTAADQVQTLVVEDQ